MKVMAGIDVGKRSLDVSVAAGPARRFDNTPAGRTALVEWLERQGATEVVCEPTGGYERPLVRRVQATGWPIHLVHPNRVRHFAQAAGSPAKTDALDAQRLARYGMAFELQRPLAKEADREVVQDLLRRRKQLVNQRVQERHRLDQGQTEGARISIERHLQWLDEEISQLDEAYQQALETQRLAGRSRRPLPQCAGRGCVDRGDASGVSAGVRALQRQGGDLVGRAGSVG